MNESKKTIPWNWSMVPKGAWVLAIATIVGWSVFYGLGGGEAFRDPLSGGNMVIPIFLIIGLLAPLFLVVLLMSEMSQGGFIRYTKVDFSYKTEGSRIIVTADDETVTFTSILHKVGIPLLQDAYVLRTYNFLGRCVSTQIKFELNKWEREDMESQKQLG